MAQQGLATRSGASVAPANHGQQKDAGPVGPRVQCQHQAEAPLVYQNTRYRRADDPSSMLRRVELGDGVQKFALSHEVRKHRQPRGHVQRLQYSQQGRRKVYVPENDDFGDGEDGQSGNHCPHQRLGDHQEVLAVDAVGDNAAGQQKDDVGQPVQGHRQTQLSLVVGDLEYQPAKDEELHAVGHGLGQRPGPIPAEGGNLPRSCYPAPDGWRRRRGRRVGYQIGILICRCSDRVRSGQPVLPAATPYRSGMPMLTLR